MAKSDAGTELEMLKQIDRKLDAVLDSLPKTRGLDQHSSSGSTLAALAKEIAALTPEVRQTDSVELLHEDRSR